MLSLLSVLNTDVLHTSPGSSAGGVDIIAHNDVGITNMVFFSKLPLQDGQAYYVTVKGM